MLGWRADSVMLTLKSIEKSLDSFVFMHLTIRWPVKLFFSEDLSACISPSHSNIIAGDLWRMDHHNDQAFTWRRPNNNEQASRLDRYCFPVGYRACFDFLNFPYSDHDCVCATLDLNSVLGAKVPVTGKSHWKINCSILSEQDFVNRFAGGRVSNKIKELSDELHQLINDSDNPARVEGLKLEIRVINYEQDEKNTAFFFNKIKESRKRKMIDSVTDPETGQLTYNQERITTVFHDFYSADLYARVPCEVSDSDFFLTFCLMQIAQIPHRLRMRVHFLFPT